MTEEFSEKQLHEIYNHEIRTMIVRLLRIYGELSLAEFSNIMSMNKTTIQYHLKILREKEVVVVSRESQEDSRGSIPTKYYQLKIKNDRYRLNFNELKNVNNVDQRLDSYRNYLESLLAGLKDVKNQIAYGESALEKLLEQLNKQQRKKITEDELDCLHNEISNLITGLTTFSTTKSNFQKIIQEIPKMYSSYENLHKENTSDEIEGYQIITLAIPLLELIKSKLETK